MSQISQLFMSSRQACLAPLENADDASQQARSDSEPISDFDVTVHVGVRAVRNRDDLVLVATPPLPPPSSPGFSAALAAKLQLVAADCFFEDADADVSAKKVKSDTLCELLDLAALAPELSVADLDKFVTAIEKPVFRPFLFVPAVYLRSDDMVIISEVAWPHVAVHYQILIALAPVARQMQTVAYIRRLCVRLQSPDMAERDALCALLMALRNANPSLTDSLATFVSNIFLDYVDKFASPHAVLPALNVYYDIVHRAPPSDDSPLYQRDYVQKVLPLLSGLHYSSFHQPMRLILTEFVAAAPQTFAIPTLRALLKFFPRTRAEKAIEFVSLLSTVVERTPSRNLTPFVRQIVQLLGRLSESSHTKLVESLFSVWNQVHLNSILMDKAKVIYPIVYPVLVRALETSWVHEISQAITKVLGLLARLDAAAYQSVAKQKGVKPLPAFDNRKCWAQVSRVAAKADPGGIDLATKLSEIQQLFSTMGPPIRVNEGTRSESVPVTAQSSQGVRTVFMSPSALILRP
jgi:hypothetical protein